MGEWHSMEDYRGKSVAIDASPCIYQCLTAMSADPGNEEDASHVLGFLKRTVRLLEIGLKPIFVFDGDAPEMKKQGALASREKMRAKSREQLVEAQAAGDEEAARRFAARLVKAKPKHNEDCMELLRLMGVPVVQAPTEAECLCAVLAASGRCDAAATEDLDALVFGAPRLLRNIHQAASSPQAKGVQEISLEAVLRSLKFSHKEFVDFCILCGCDYLGTIARVGVQTAYQLMTKHRSIEQLLERLDRSKFTVPESWEYQAARDTFLTSPVPDIHIFKLEATRPDARALEELRALAVERYRFHAGEIDQYIQRFARATHADIVPQQVPESAHPHYQHSAPTHRPIATPNRSQQQGLTGHLARRNGAGRRPSRGSATASTSAVPVGQKTLKSLFAASAKRPAPDVVVPLAPTAEDNCTENSNETAIKTPRKTLTSLFAASAKRPAPDVVAPLAPTAEDNCTESSSETAIKAPLASVLDEPCTKRRRTMAESALRRVLGDDISLGQGASLEDLEKLVVQLTGQGGAANSAGGSEVCQID